MLSKKYLLIKKILTGISRIDIVQKKLIVLSKMYLDIDKGYRFSYLGEENGENELLDKLASHYTTGLTFFDVGAHVGSYTDSVTARFKNYKGHLFDLSPDTLKICIDRHGNDTNLKINEVALTDSNGEVEYRYYPGHLNQQTAISGVGPYLNHKYEIRKAPSLTGDHYCRENQVTHIDLLKIDTEGYDLHVLKGFDTMLSEGKIDVIQFEYNIKSSETHSMLGDFYAYLTARGYEIGVLRQHGVEFKTFNYVMNDFNLGPNYVACRPALKNLLSAPAQENKKVA